MMESLVRLPTHYHGEEKKWHASVYLTSACHQLGRQLVDLDWQRAFPGRSIDLSMMTAICMSLTHGAAIVLCVVGG